MPRGKAPTLKFGPTTKKSGFTSLNYAQFSDLSPARVIRELIQNSLDAADEAGETMAKVSFMVERISESDVPDVSGYARHFQGAEKHHANANGGLTDNAKQVVRVIRGALKRLSSADGVPCLFVVDNGVGLDEDRMTALLGDGASAKREGAAGSYGVGHLAPIPASDLRYVLYGGVKSGGQRIASGYAMLASRADSDSEQGYMLSPDGYLVDGFLNGADGNPYKFISPSDAPRQIAEMLNKIESSYWHGAVVMIPAFNYFRRRSASLWEVVSKVAAYNFSAAIHTGRLLVLASDKTQGDQEERFLMRETLAGVLEQDKDATRAARRGSFYGGLRPSGRNAYSAYKAQVDGERRAVDTGEGEIEIRLLTDPPSGSARVDLFRNGMWITDDVSRLRRSDFASRQPFHAVLLLDSQSGGELHRLIRKSEGPMHDKLYLNLLDENERRRLRSAIDKIADAIRDMAPEIGDDSYTPDDYFAVDAGGEGGSGGRRTFAFWGAPTMIQTRTRSLQARETGGGGNGGGGNGGGNGNGNGGTGTGQGTGGGSSRSSRPFPFRADAVPDGVGKHRIALRCDRAIPEAILSLRLDENTDATCDRIWTDEDVSLKKFDIKPADSNESLEWDWEGDGSGGKKRVRILGVSADTEYTATVEYDTPDGFSQVVSAPVFRVELHRPPPPPPPPPAMQGGKRGAE